MTGHDLSVIRRLRRDRGRWRPICGEAGFRSSGAHARAASAATRTDRRWSAWRESVPVRKDDGLHPVT